ncbi:MAG TPA: hypothetical protein VGM90_14615 [Kofleriaceae bacterium]|jgi:hypothetical protein
MRMYALLALACLAPACEDQNAPLVWMDHMVTSVNKGGELPLRDGIPTDPDLAAELAVATIAIRQSASIAMEHDFQSAAGEHCVHGKLVGARNDPTLSVIMANDKVVHASVTRRCDCKARCEFAAK